MVIKRYLAIALTVVLVGCAEQSLAERQYLAQLHEREDDLTCRRFIEHKKPDDYTTYEQCRQDLVYNANHPPTFSGSPSSPNVTVIVNQ